MLKYAPQYPENCTPKTEEYGEEEEEFGDGVGGQKLDAPTRYEWVDVWASERAQDLLWEPLHEYGRF